MKYSSDEIRNIPWTQWNELMAQELNDAGFRTQGMNKDSGRIEPDQALFTNWNQDPSTFIVTVDTPEKINYLKGLGLLNNGRCPMCGGIIEGLPASFHLRNNPYYNYHICNNCATSNQRRQKEGSSGCGLFAIVLDCGIIYLLYLLISKLIG